LALPEEPELFVLLPALDELPEPLPLPWFELLFGFLPGFDS
jgi:hypothetical protein